jgi:hypothetical protein
VHFSIWRLAWVAHQLPADPWHLFDANIFYPARGTLALSDAMLLVGALGMPFFHAGVSPAIVHNYLMLAAIVSSMLCAFALARRMTGSDPAAWLAAVIFGLAPYRMAHIGHLELQWTMWMPLAMLLLASAHGKADARARILSRAGAGSASVLQHLLRPLPRVLSRGGVAGVDAVRKGQGKNRCSNSSGHRAAVAGCRCYGPPYSATRAELGERRADEVATYSAVPGDYLRVPQENVLRGHPNSGPAPTSGACSPGSSRYSSPSAPLFRHSPEPRSSTLILAIVAADFSLGVNGILFAGLQILFSMTASLRAPARFGALVLLSVATLAAIGAARALSALAASSHRCCRCC